ncbi:hypothetical protein JCM30471_02070 [Desulfuromonas carbonis]|uniref:tetratricopeptide repeat protein n=1 Tax=Desulfuromonas sp. DDH964 TaxID=1823759 RepID=UPI00078DC1A4|nr:tetratricopeptide repeat protein [Desulfuromonas sp. DDH964]AMV71731.1 radical SAM domain-containing iron-sulfur cluster-binding oxidoreductase [Desulfuromonas sp. DDH964]
MSRGSSWQTALAGLAMLVILSLFPNVALALESGGDGLVERYREALRVDPDNLPLHYFLGMALLLAGDNQGAVAEFRLAYPAFTDSVEMHYNLGLAYARLGDLDSAQLYFDQAESLGALDEPEVYPLANAYYNLALAYLEKENLDEARRLLSKVLALAPDRLEIHRLIGDSLARSGQIDAALEEFSRYLDHYPSDTSAREYVYALHFNRGLKALELNDLAAARSAFSNALAAAPDSPVALYYLGTIAYRSGDYAGAIEILGPIYAEAPAELRSSTHSMLYNSALTLLERKSYAAARQAAKALVATPDATAKDYYLAGNIDLALKEFAPAATNYRRVLALEPTHRGATVNLVAAQNGAADAAFAEGRRLYGDQDYRGALDYFEQALAMVSGDPRALAFAAKARAALARQAEEHFAAARSALAAGNPRLALEEATRGLAADPAAAAGNDLKQQALDRLSQEISGGLEEGQRLAAAGDLAAATAAYRRVLELAPGEPRAQAGLDAVAAQSREAALEAIARQGQALDEGRLDDAAAALALAKSFAPNLAEVEVAEKRLESMVNTLVAEELLWGRRAHSAGQLAEAREHFNNALALKDSPEVRQELSSLAAASADKAASLLDSARQATAAHNFKRARILYDRLLALVPDHAEARREQGELENAVDRFVVANLVKAKEALAAGNLEGALASYRKVLDIDPANPQALTGLEAGRKQLAGRLADLVRDGNRALGDGHFSEAAATFRQALAIDPYQAEARGALKRIDQLRLSGVNPGDEQALYLQGIEFYTRGRYREAIDAWQKVLALDPGHEKSRMNIEKAQRKLQRIEEFRGG